MADDRCENHGAKYMQVVGKDCNLLKTVIEFCEIISHDAPHENRGTRRILSITSPVAVKTGIVFSAV